MGKKALSLILSAIFVTGLGIVSVQAEIRPDTRAAAEQQAVEAAQNLVKQSIERGMDPIEAMKQALKRYPHLAGAIVSITLELAPTLMGEEIVAAAIETSPQEMRTDILASAARSGIDPTGFIKAPNPPGRATRPGFNVNLPIGTTPPAGGGGGVSPS